MDTSSAANHIDSQRVFHNNPRTLADLAAIKFAFCMRVLELDTKVMSAVPTFIKNVIESTDQLILKEIQCWFEGSTDVLRHLTASDIYARYHLIIFGGNGTIHFKATIANFLRDDTLSYMTRFEMACVYCIEEEVDYFLPLVCDTLHFDQMQFDGDFMMYYWICKKWGELSRIPLGRFQRIEHLMIDKCRQQAIWLAIEYFVHQLDRNGRIEQMYKVFTLPSDTRLKCAKYLLPYLDGTFQLAILNTRPMDILKTLVQDYTTIEYFVQAWISTRDFITADQYYHELILPLIQYKNYNEPGAAVDCLFSDMVLAELWSNSSYHLRETIMNECCFDILEKMSTNFVGNTSKNQSRDIRFVVALLSNADAPMRNYFWQTYWSKWISHVRAFQFEELTKLCLANTQEIEAFKRIVQRAHVFREYLDTLVAKELNEELNEILCFVYSDQDDANNITRFLIGTKQSWIYDIRNLNDIDILKKFAKFADNILVKNDLAQDFKERFISSKKSLKKMYAKIKSNDFSDIMTIGDLYLSSEKKIELGNKFLYRLRTRRIMTGILRKFDASYWTDFVRWCSNNDETQIREFLDSLPICDVFQTAYCNCLKYRPYETTDQVSNTKCTFDDLYKFLCWYFESTSLCENFIRDRMQFYREMDEEEVCIIFGEVLNKNSAVYSMNDD